ncbi:Protein kinase-like domain containing protein [Lactarius tabidus]
MFLELCPSGSLMNMLHRRRIITEPEARFFIAQLIGACHYMHTHQFIHRDLKLGNLFLDADMNIKVGDFGLAALIESPEEWKKLSAVLFDTPNRHSFEVDTWSISVILYTFVIGRPPFQTKDVKEVYQHTRDNQYEFPSHRDISVDVRELMQQILTPHPQERPSLHDIVDHGFFTCAIVPGYIPISARDMPPDFRHISPPVSQANLSYLRQACQLDGDVAPCTEHDNKPPTPSASSASSLAQQERDSRRQYSPAVASLRCLASHVSRSWSRRARRLQDITEGGVVACEKQGEEVRMKESQIQKARVVAQMMPAQSPFEDAENVVPESTQGERRVGVRVKETLGEQPPPTTYLRISCAGADRLCTAFDVYSQGLLFRDPNDDVDLLEERVFIASLLDYGNKYGMGYALADGSTGVHFNDSTPLVLAADKQHFDYISSRRQGTVYVRKKYTVADYPEELKSKLYLLKHFESYSMGKLFGDYEYTFLDLQRTKYMHFVQKYLRMKHVIFAPVRPD